MISFKTIGGLFVARADASSRLVNWVSYADAMHDSALVVCHAGHGTLMQALRQGVPVLAVAHSGDMPENAARIDWAGVGVRLPWRLVSPTTLRLAVGRALESRQALATRAAELSAWAALNDGPTRASELLEKLTG